jgi:hypothetical protein
MLAKTKMSLGTVLILLLELMLKTVHSAPETLQDGDVSNIGWLAFKEKYAKKYSDTKEEYFRYGNYN